MHLVCFTELDNGKHTFWKNSKKTYVSERNYSPTAWELYLACSVILKA